MYKFTQHVYVHKTCTSLLNMYMFTQHIVHVHSTCICSHNVTTWTCSLNMYMFTQHGHVHSTCICSHNMDMLTQHVQYMYIVQCTYDMNGTCLHNMFTQHVHTACRCSHKMPNGHVHTACRCAHNMDMYMFTQHGHVHVHKHLLVHQACTC